MGIVATDISYSKKVPYARFPEANTASSTPDSISISPLTIPFRMHIPMGADVS